MEEALNRQGKPLNEAKVLILGFSFKPDCPDIRNTKIYDVIQSLMRYGTKVVVFDPWVDPVKVNLEYECVTLVSSIGEAVALGPYDVIVRAVAHSAFRDIDFSDCRTPDCVECAIINPDSI